MICAPSQKNNYCPPIASFRRQCPAGWFPPFRGHLTLKGFSPGPTWEPAAFPQPPREVGEWILRAVDGGSPPAAFFGRLRMDPPPRESLSKAQGPRPVPPSAPTPRLPLRSPFRPHPYGGVASFYGVCGNCAFQTLFL